MFKINEFITTDSNSDCIFALGGICNALACYSSAPCSAKDENGNPRYRENRDYKAEEIK